MPEMTQRTDVVREVDDALTAPALVIRSESGDGIRLELLARPQQVAELGELLSARGFVPWGTTWARFDGDVPESVELTGTDGAGDDALFLVGEPLPGFRNLLHPAPHVRLVLAARALVAHRGHLPADLREQAEKAAAAGDEVWADATGLADRLQLSGPLTMLRRLLSRPEGWTGGQRARELARALAASPSAIRRLTPRRLRPVLISVSGPDGSGKSTQTVLLRESLAAIGVPAANVWAPSIRPPLPTAIRSRIRRVRRKSAASVGVGGGSRPAAAPRPAPARVRAVQHAWITAVTFANAASMWKHVWQWRNQHVLVLDRFALDAEVKFAYWYANRRTLNVRFERRLLRALCPAADVTVLLRVAPETNFSRRADEFTLEQFVETHQLYAEVGAELGAVVVNGERPKQELARTIAEAVWRRLP